MLVVETIAKIWRAYFVQKKAIKEICRAQGAANRRDGVHLQADVKKPNLAIEPVRSRRVKPTRFTRPPFSPSIGSRPVMVPTSFEER
jgi:hypothetical protein